jgi:hydroxymethylpyrimidine/phosphomethylpyrimidine kinase
VQAVQEINADIVAAQIDAVIEDIGVDAAKTGMLFSPEIIKIVVERVCHWQLRLVVDPVMVAKSGEHLLQPEAVRALKHDLLPLAEIATPNIPEAEVLGGRAINSLVGMRDAARAIYDFGARYVIVKGGHSAGLPVDVLFDGEQFVELTAERILTRNTHGTGCTFSAALTALLARHVDVHQAMVLAKRYVSGAIAHAPEIGQGHGPTEHFWLWAHASSDREAALSVAEAPIG